MKNYYSTLRAIFLVVIGLHISLYFFGLLRLSILYDYLDYWPLTLIPIILVLIPRSEFITETIKFYSYAVLISVGLIFLPKLIVFFSPRLARKMSISSKHVSDAESGGDTPARSSETTGSASRSTEVKNPVFGVTTAAEIEMR